jgi:hypothetical protein
MSATKRAHLHDLIQAWLLPKCPLSITLGGWAHNSVQSLLPGEREVVSVGPVGIVVPRQSGSWAAPGWVVGVSSQWTYGAAWASPWEQGRGQRVGFGLEPYSQETEEGSSCHPRLAHPSLHI